MIVQKWLTFIGPPCRPIRSEHAST